MSLIVFDIETKAASFDSLDELSQNYFLKFARSEQEEIAAKSSLSFYPLTSEIISLAMLEVATERGVVFYQNPSEPNSKFCDNSVTFISCCEKDILKYFWKNISRYERFVTFNGRCFDCPFIMIRSATREVAVTRNLCPYRFSSDIHIDLADQLTFYDSMKRRFNLHMWCNALGIKSPKEGTVRGDSIGECFEEGRFLDIAKYCLDDVAATKALYCKWASFIKP